MVRESRKKELLKAISIAGYIYVASHVSSQEDKAILEELRKSVMNKINADHAKALKKAHIEL